MLSFFRELCLAGTDIVVDLFEKDRKLVKFHKLRQLGLPDKLYFKWMQLIDAFSRKWKVMIRNHPNNSEVVVFEYSLYWQIESELCTIDISGKSMYDKLLEKIKTQPSIKYWKEKFGSHLDEINWKKSNTKIFHNRIIHKSLSI